MPIDLTKVIIIVCLWMVLHEAEICIYNAIDYACRCFPCVVEEIALEYNNMNRMWGNKNVSVA